MRDDDCIGRMVEYKERMGSVSGTHVKPFDNNNDSAKMFYLYIEMKSYSYVLFSCSILMLFDGLLELDAIERFDFHCCQNLWTSFHQLDNVFNVSCSRFE